MKLVQNALKMATTAYLSGLLHLHPTKTVLEFWPNHTELGTLRR